MAKKAFNTTIDESLYRKVKLLAAAKGMKINELIERGLIHVLEEESKNNDEELEYGIHKKN